ncbi:MAG TPA: holo-ACP synthase [Thermoanaerobaculia bacterium]|jgi:holo-[acyl-carrier protein] synthase
MTDRVGLLLGLDLTEVGRIAEVLDRHGDRFLARVFRDGEIRRSRRHPRALAEHVAGRFAAKEAAMKALGTGWRGVAFREIEIGREPSGKPRVAFHGRALERSRALRVLSAEVTITHTRDIAAAVVALLVAPP